jgi:hypothetical protein
MRWLLPLVVAGCSAADPCAGVKGACITLTVTSMGALNIDELRVTAAGAVDGTMTSSSSHGQKLPVDLPVALPAGAGGALELFVEGLSGGMVLASGEADLNVVVDERNRASVDIEPPMMSPPPDLGGDGPPSSTPDLALPFDTACDDEAQQRCARLAACSTASPTEMQRQWGMQATCEARLKLDCLLESAAPDTGLTPALVERCAAAWSSELCSDRFAGFAPLPCAVSGARANGAGCFYDSQCTSGFCQLLSDHGCGTCSAATTASISSCTVAANCGGRQTCVSNVCQVLSDLNQPCNAAHPCGEELSCVNSTCVHDGNTVGTACDTSATTAAQCDLDVGLYCGTNNTCAVAQVASPSPSPQCGLLGGVRTLCTGGADCFNGVCKGPANDGAGCDLNNGPFCRPPARCVGNLCRLPVPSDCN